MSHSIDTERQALALFRKLLELDTGDRARLDAELAEAEPELAARVRRMLERHHSLTNRLERPWQQEMAQLGLPSQLGAFTLVRELGRGGMGIVAEGQREAEGFTQRVAIKWIPAWQVDAARRQRFLFERDVVARLRHPHIARLVDGGEGSEGELWYAMELVDGKDLLSHCRERGLGLRERVQLLLDLCDAVAHAHRHLILHRDIKPSNVLVDDEGQLKLIDFGIAKGLDSDSDDLTLDAAPMTPRYAAPEQLRGERPTTLSDLWQVAALAFELLSGQPARKDGGLRKASDATMESGVEHAVSCGLDSTRLKRALQGDLDALLERALSDKPEQRYANIEAFCDELRAWLSGRPVLARRHERWYAAKRFALQHRWSLGFASLALVAVIGAGIVAVTLGAKAQEEARTSEHANTLMLRLMLGNNDRAVNAMTLREYFDYVTTLVVEDVDLPPLRRFELLFTILDSTSRMGPTDAVERASMQLSRSAADLFGAQSRQFADATVRWAHLALVRREQNAAPEAESALDEAYQIYKHLNLLGSPEMLGHLRVRGHLANVMEDVSSMIAVSEEMEKIARSNDTVSDRDKVGISGLLASAYFRAQRYREASATMERVVAEIQELGERGEPAPDLLLYHRARACEYHSFDAPARAIDFCGILQTEIRAAEKINSEVGVTVLRGLARAKSELKDHEGALALLLEADLAAGVVFGVDGMTPIRVRVRRSLGSVYFELGRFAESAEARRGLLAWSEARKSRESEDALEMRVELLEALVRAGQQREVEELLDETLNLSALSNDYRLRWEQLRSLSHGGQPSG
jgi:hypothetical protein